MKRGNRAPVGKIVLNASVQKTLHRKSFGQQHVVIPQLHVEIPDAFRPDLNDPLAIDQATNRNQDAVDEDRMIG